MKNTTTAFIVTAIVLVLVLLVAFKDKIFATSNTASSTQPLTMAQIVAGVKAALGATPTKATTDPTKPPSSGTASGSGGGSGSGSGGGSGSGTGTGTAKQSTPVKATGDVKIDFDPITGAYAEKDKDGNETWYTFQGVALETYDPTNGTYIEADDPTTLYSKEGEAIGDLNDQTGMFEDESGNVIAASDGSAVINSLTNGDYQEADGTWYNQSGDEIEDPTNSGNYQEADGTWYNQSGEPIDPPDAPQDPNEIDEPTTD